MAAAGTGVKRGNGRPAPPDRPPRPSPLSSDSLCTAAPPPHMRGHGSTPWLGVVVEPAAGRIPSVPPVGGWSRLGASSRPQIGRWDRRQCHMPDFWVTWRPRNPLSASAATFCAAGVISMHRGGQEWYGGLCLGSLGGDFNLLVQAATARGSRRILHSAIITRRFSRGMARAGPSPVPLSSKRSPFARA
jgi:hypothetical protein